MSTKECCKDQTTPYCPTRGEPIQGYPLIEIKVYFEGRLKSAESRLTARQDAARNRNAAGAETDNLDVAAAAETVDKWTRWVRLIEIAMERWTGEQSELDDDDAEDATD